MKALYPHQHTGAEWLAWRPYACLFDEMGLGKSLTAIRAADRAGALHILVMCPSVVKHHWFREFAENQTVQRRIVMVKGTVKEQLPAPSVCIISHDATVRDTSIRLLFQSGFWDLIIIDEADAFRNPTSKRTMNTLGDLPWSLWKAAHRVWYLTGTPIVNGAVDLYPVMSSILAGPLRRRLTYEEFTSRYSKIKPGFKQGQVIYYGVENAPELFAALQPWALRRELKDVAITLPPLRMTAFPLQIEQGTIDGLIALMRHIPYDLYTQMIEEGDEQESISRIRHAVALAKAPYAADYALHLLQHGQWPLVLFYIHQDVAAAIQAKLAPHFSTIVLDGSTSSRAGEIVNDFQAGKYAAALIQFKAGGAGITLTRAQRALIIEQPWTNKDLVQAIKRLHRIGQKSSVLGEVLYAEGLWFDTLAARIIAEKAMTADKILNHERMPL